MTTGRVVTNISGGNVNIGNISIGNGNQITSGTQSNAVDLAVSGFFKDLEQSPAIALRSNTEIAALRSEVAGLQASIHSSAAPKESLIDKAHRIYEKYAWAAGPLKSLFSILFPGMAL